MTTPEFWDVLDEFGNKTGRLHERGRNMAAGDYHLVVHVWKYNKKGEWLIDLRSASRGTDIDGKWETTGGAALAGEDSLTAALREAKEELGLTLDPAKGALFHRTTRHADNGRSWFQDAWVFEHDCPVEDVRFQENETCEAMWATAGKIREMMAGGEFLSDWHYPYFNEMADRFTPYYLAYERRYRAVYAAGAKLWGHAADDAIFIGTLTDWVEKNNLRGRKVIEYACGEGSVGVILSRLGCAYLGVDIAPTAVERSRQALAEYPDATVSVLDMVGERVEGVYDAAVDSMGLHMLVTDADRKSYLENMNAALANNAPALFFRESYRRDMPDYAVDSIEEWVKITGDDYEKHDTRQVVNDGVVYNVDIPLVPARAKSRAGYEKEMAAAGFAMEDFVEMDASDAIVSSATLYVRKKRRLGI